MSVKYSDTKMVSVWNWDKLDYGYAQISPNT